jgi:hypothetical protein
MSAFRRLRQEDYEFKASSNYITRSYLKQTKFVSIISKPFTNTQ